jgi:hypothetical protein
VNIKNAEVERLAEEIAAMTGESKTEASATRHVEQLSNRQKAGLAGLSRHP